MILIDDALVFAAVAAIPPLDRMESLLSMEQGHGVPPAAQKPPASKSGCRARFVPRVLKQFQVSGVAESPKSEAKSPSVLLPKP